MNRSRASICFLLSVFVLTNCLAAGAKEPQKKPSPAGPTKGETRGIIAILGLDGAAEGVVRAAKEKAYTVYFQSADSYYESYTLEELLRPRVLLVLRMNGQPLSRDHGFPLRLIAPYKYGYKNIKYITGMEFTDTRKRNYWADSGPYSVDGTIQPGIDHPLDYKKKPFPINGGEVFHFFDKRPTPTQDG